MDGDHGPMDRERERIVADARDLTPKPDGPVNGNPKLGGLIPKGSVASVRCQATNRRGEQCGKWAVVGGTVCATHGAAQGTAARRAAAERLLALRPLAQKTLQRAMVEEDVPWSQKVRAASIVLDYVEPKQPQQHRHEVEVTEVSRALDERIARAMEARFGPIPALDQGGADVGEILDAEVVEPVVIEPYEP